MSQATCGYLLFAPRATARRRPGLGPNGSFRAEGGAPTQSTVLPSDVEQREAHQKPVRFLSSAHPTRSVEHNLAIKPPTRG
nr:hypothetical protein [Methylomarinum sp. Ch1-1]MDP4520745.1 hypothetical protein [Methylomarinum sp. Ch1-1]